METFEVVVEKDHVENLAKAKPIKAISELIWNAYDADATEVRVEFEEGPLTKLGLVRVIDDGTGIPYADAPQLFKSIGGSWKRMKRRTDHGRRIHGTKGQGRLKAFALGTTVDWISSCDGKRFTIAGSIDNIKQFQISDPAATTRHGCTVEITNVVRDFHVRAEHNFVDVIRDIFALQLYEDNSFRLIYDGVDIDSSDAIESVTPVVISAQTEDGVEYSARLEIVEWLRPVQRKLLLCLPGRFSFHDIPPGIQARGFHFTAYLTADYFEHLAEENREGLVELDTPSQSLIDAAKEAMRSHFRERETERSRAKIEEWQATGLYPYSGVAGSPIERNERQIFDVVALSLADYSSEFENSPRKTQKLVFQLLKSAVETGPSVLPNLLAEVISLPQERQEEMANLLQKTTLSAIIEAANDVASRLDFLRALQILIYNPSSKRELLERSQLHRIIARDAWLFGEQYNLVNDDEDLTSVLRTHLRLLGQDRNELSPTVDQRVLDTDGRSAIVDLMLSQRIPLPDGSKRQHLVVEIKRPSQPVNEDVISQIKRYAQAVANDSRFRDNDVEWDFIAVSNELSEGARLDASQRDRKPGLVAEYTNPNVKVWVKTWGQIVQEAEGRLTFYRRRLDYQANDEQALTYLRSMNADLLSPEVRKRISEIADKERAAP